MCKFIIESISPEFDPNRVLRRRVFINEEKTRYVSVGFYSAQNYQTLAEIGGLRIKPLIVREQHVATMAVSQLRICDAMRDNGQFGRSDGAFRLNTSGSYGTARLWKNI